MPTSTTSCGRPFLIEFAQSLQCKIAIMVQPTMQMYAKHVRTRIITPMMSVDNCSEMDECIGQSHATCTIPTNTVRHNNASKMLRKMRIRRGEGEGERKKERRVNRKDTGRKRKRETKKRRKWETKKGEKGVQRITNHK